MADTVVVTGGSGGLGGAVVRRLVTDGWRVVVPDLAAPRSPVDGVSYVSVDLFSPTDVSSVVSDAASDVDRPLRAVVNLVGGYSANGLVHETPIDDFEAQLRLNLRPTYLVCAAALPFLMAAGGGSIVCVSTRAAVRPFSGAAGYVTAKAAVLALVDALAVEYRQAAVRANAILPSVIDTPANRASMPNASFDTWVKPEEIAEVIAFLCSDASAVTSGAHIPVYGRA
ncbi:MAG TPA: SDR family oxidoreductase [Micromonosporaceae bacterium]|nr:SDR family oxidoreductase [Micromonosporaceae bacterium]